MRTWPIVAAIVAVILTGCSADRVDRPEAEPPGGSVEGKSEQDGLLLDSRVLFKRTGGLAGYNDRIEISREGALKGNASGASVAKALAQEQVAKLARLLDESRLFDVEQSFEAEGADLITYTVQYRHKTVVAQDTNVPNELRPVLDFLSALLE